MFDGQVQTEKRINLLYDDVARHYHVIVNITGAMAKRYVCKACNKECCSDVTNPNRRAVIVCQFLHARFPMFESRASCAIEHLGVERVSTSTRKISCGERQCVNKRKTVPRLVVCLQIKRSTSAISRTVRTVIGIWRSDISVTWRR